MALNMKKVKPLRLMSRKERVRERSFMARKTRVEDQVPLQTKRRRRIFHAPVATHAINLDTMPEIAEIQRRGGMTPQLQMLKKTPSEEAKE